MAEQPIINLIRLVNLVVAADVNLGMICLVLVLPVDGFVIINLIIVLAEHQVVAVILIAHGQAGVVILMYLVLQMIIDSVSQGFNTGNINHTKWCDLLFVKKYAKQNV